MIILFKIMKIIMNYNNLKSRLMINKINNKFKMKKYKIYKKINNNNKKKNKNNRNL